MARHILVLFVVFFASFVGANEIPTPTETIQIPMRDGTLLPADLYFPSVTTGEKLPCILLRNPSGKNAPQWLPFTALADYGYIVCIQSTRSAIDTEGKSLPYWSDGWSVHQDGYDTVEWLAAQPYVNGKVGTIGFSAVGITQLLLAPTAPPALKCQYISVAAASLYHQALFSGGQLLKDQVENWLRLYAPDSGVHSIVVNQPFFNDFWLDFDSRRVANRVKAPGIHIGGWYDTFLQGTLDGFESRQKFGGTGAKGAQKLVIGPWTHLWPEEKRLGDFEVPKEGYTPPIDLSPIRWFEYYLKDVDNGIKDEPPVTYYVMGPFDGEPSSGNVWRHAHTWPVPAAHKSFYLHPDHKLVYETPAWTSTVVTYIDDPENPVPTIGGNNLFLPSGPKDQSPIESRSDIALFTTEPFTEDVEITGHIEAKLFFSTTVPDTDLVVRVTDVYPDGRSILICDGIRRTGNLPFTHDLKKPSQIDIQLACTSIVLAKGHCLRVSIAGSNFPRYEKNPNVGIMGSNRSDRRKTPHNIHISSDYPSRVILPIVRQGNLWMTANREES